MAFCYFDTFVDVLIALSGAGGGPPERGSGLSSGVPVHWYSLRVRDRLDRDFSRALHNARHRGTGAILSLY